MLHNSSYIILCSCLCTKSCSLAEASEDLVPTKKNKKIKNPPISYSCCLPALMLLQRFSWRQLLPLFAFLLCLLPAVFIFASPKEAFKSALRQLDPMANGSHSWKIRSKTFILASLKRSAFNWITNVMDFCAAHFQPSHIFKTICKTNILEQFSLW